MGKRGPAPKPTALRVLHGDQKSRINDEEPVPASGEVVPPAWLSSDALKVWAQYAPDLIAQQVMSTWDPAEFAVWCDAVARHAKAAQMLDQQGEVVDVCVGWTKGDDAEPIFKPQKNPWQLIWRETADTIQRFGARFGMSPSDRAQIRTGGSKSDDRGAERLLS